MGALTRRWSAGASARRRDRAEEGARRRRRRRGGGRGARHVVVDELRWRCGSSSRRRCRKRRGGARAARRRRRLVDPRALLLEPHLVARPLLPAHRRSLAIEHAVCRLEPLDPLLDLALVPLLALLAARRGALERAADRRVAHSGVPDVVDEGDGGRRRGADGSLRDELELVERQRGGARVGVARRLRDAGEPQLVVLRRRGEVRACLIGEGRGPRDAQDNPPSVESLRR